MADNTSDRQAEGGLLGRHLRPLLDQRDATVDAMAAAVQEQVADYRTFATPEDEAAWAAGLAALLDLFLTLAAEDRWLTPAESHGIRSIGAVRAQQGFTASSVRASVRAAVGVARTLIVDEYEPANDDDRAAMKDVLDLLHRFASTVEDLLQDGHARRIAELRATGGENAARLLHDVLDGAVTDDATYEDRAASVGCDPSISHLLFLTDAEAGPKIAALARPELSGVHVVARPTPVSHGVVAVAVPLPIAGSSPLARVSELAAKARTTVLYLGRYNRPLDAHLRYAGAVPLVPHLARLADRRPILHADDLALYRLAAALPEPVRASLHHEVFGELESLAAGEARRLYDALACFVRHNFRTAGVERETGRNRKTVYLTRDRLSAATGRSLLDAADQTVLSIAYAVHRIGG